MLQNLSPKYSHKQHQLNPKKRKIYSITFVIITKDRPEIMKHLIRSILKTQLASCSIILIDDSNNDNFIKTRRFLQSYSIPFKQLNSSQAGRLAEKSLERTNLTPDEKIFIRECTGLRSPFCNYIEQLLEPSRPELDLNNCLQFAPYSPARNLGIYIATRFFNPNIIIFLDDDCLILHPEKIYDQLLLFEAKINQKRIIAISGIYKNLSLRFSSERTRAQSLKKIQSILRGMDTFIRESFLTGEARFRIMPPHMLGGALILHKKSFSLIPFDPYIARGEDHSYALDLKRFFGEDEIAVRDERFIIGHQKEHSKSSSVQRFTELNVLRDIFRFVYIRVKTGISFITLFMVRWTLTSLCNLFLNPSNYKQYKIELLALLFVAPKYAKENGSKFRRGIKAWNR
ncbi:MAG: glycosyltransferase family A protein, partial [Candidatus Bathyarchaeota archaeon]